MMEAFDKMINSVFSGGDPIFREWFLIRETYLPFLLAGCYVLFCTLIGPALMRNRKPFNLRGCMVVFNFAIVAVYITTIIMGAIYLPMVTWEEFCYSGSFRKEDYSYKLAYGIWVIYLIKYLEYLDTVFFVLRKKANQISFLHVFHHTVVPLIGWALLRTESNAIQSVPLVINCLVHAIMYTYYGLAAMGPQVQKYLGWKKYLTQLQMVQFVVIILFATVGAPLLGCRMDMVGYIIVMGAVSVFLYLFYVFYQDKFRQKND